MIHASPGAPARGLDIAAINTINVKTVLGTGLSPIVEPGREILLSPS